VKNLATLFNITLYPFSSSTPCSFEGHGSSHSTSFPSNHFQRDLHPPSVEVNRFDGLDTICWVTQMEHYFSLYGITDELSKLRYGVLHIDMERWQWWKWRKNSRQGYVAWTQFVAEIYECFDTDTHHLVHLTKLKQSGTIEECIAYFYHLAFLTKGMSSAFFRNALSVASRMRFMPVFSWIALIVG
jgi:hypothetical protein